MTKKISIIIIGRNEGQRLKVCVKAAMTVDANIIYVDSGSTDQSVAWVTNLGIPVVELDSGIPFTAARARNAGFEALQEAGATSDYLQFIDGDCEISTNWLPDAVRFMESNPLAAIVCGRLRERYPDASIYNRLCDIEWDRPPGEIDACGGIFLIRSDAFRQSTGFNEILIAGEEQELCTRLVALNMKVFRISNEMALHDAAMTSFIQWWKRSVRTGYGFGQAAGLSQQVELRHQRRRAWSAWVWGFGIPILTVACFGFSPILSFILLSLYPLQWIRIFFAEELTRLDLRVLHSTFLLLGKFPEALGQLKYWIGKKPSVAAKALQCK